MDAGKQPTIARIRQAFGYGDAPWLARRSVQAALGLLVLWLVGTIAGALWRAATTNQPTADQIDSYLAGLLLPGIVLPAIVLAILGSRLAWGLIAAFEGLDLLNNVGGPASLAAHFVLAVVVVLAAWVVLRTGRSEATLPGALRSKAAVWKLINLYLAVSAALLAFLAFASTAGYAAHHGNLPLVTPAASMLVAAIAWTGSVVLAIYFWKRRPFLLWAFVPAVFLIGFATMSAACPGCSWASR